MKLRITFLVAAFVVGLFISLYAQSDARTYYTCRQGSAQCVRTSHGEMVSVNDDSVNVDGIADNAVSNARSVQAVVTSVLDLVIPAMLPDAGGECGEDSGIAC